MTSSRRNPFRSIYDSEAYLLADRVPLRPYPLLLDFELTNRCNLNCLQCWRHGMNRPLTQLDTSLVMQVLEEASGNVLGVRFIGHGESLMHKDFFDIVTFAKNRGLVVHLTTNGLLLNHDKLGALLDTGLDSIVFSFQGTDAETYGFMRNNTLHGKLEHNIQTLVVLRGERSIPYIVVNTSILDETDEQVTAFKSYWSQWADEVGHWFTTLERISNIEHVKPLLPRQQIRNAMKGRMRCIEVFTKMSINSDGQASLCCNDYNGELAVGNVEETLLRDLWNSKAACILREKIHADFRQIPFCRMCSNKFNRVMDDE